MSISPLHIVAPLQTPPPAVHSNQASTSPSDSSSTLNTTSAASTFLSMLVTELQNQDPTSPMDPTDMVGQMFSMNQLQQLIDINQTLQSIAGYAPTSAAGNATSQSTQPITGAQ